MTPETRKLPFKIYLPATKDKDAEFVKTIEVDVYTKDGQDFLTQESNELIEKTTAQAMGSLHSIEIKTLRKKLNLTQSNLSDLIGCGKKTLSRWENGRGFPTSTYNKFLRLLDEGIVSPEQLKNIQSPRPTEKEKNFFAARPESIYYHDFKVSKPPRAAVQRLIEWKPQPEIAIV